MYFHISHELLHMKLITFSSQMYFATSHIFVTGCNILKTCVIRSTTTGTSDICTETKALMFLKKHLSVAV